MRELVVNSAGASQFLPQNGMTCHNKNGAKCRASVSLAQVSRIQRSGLVLFFLLGLCFRSGDPIKKNNIGASALGVPVHVLSNGIKFCKNFSGETQFPNFQKGALCLILFLSQIGLLLPLFCP